MRTIKDGVVCLHHNLSEDVLVRITPTHEQSVAILGGPASRSWLEVRGLRNRQQNTTRELDGYGWQPSNDVSWPVARGNVVRAAPSDGARRGNQSTSFVRLSKCSYDWPHHLIVCFRGQN